LATIGAKLISPPEALGAAAELGGLTGRPLSTWPTATAATMIAAPAAPAISNGLFFVDGTLNNSVTEY
jgi:hypothetical protein